MMNQDFMFGFGVVKLFAQEYEHRNEECTSLSVESDHGLLFSLKTSSPEGDLDKFEKTRNTYLQNFKELVLHLKEASKTLGFDALREHLSQKFYGEAFDASDLED